MSNQRYTTGNVSVTWNAILSSIRNMEGYFKYNSKYGKLF